MSIDSSEDRNPLNFSLNFLREKQISKGKNPGRRVWYILAVLVIFRRDSDSSFVAVAAAALSVAVLVLLLFAAREENEI
jgi:hypothetical protein